MTAHSTTAEIREAIIRQVLAHPADIAMVISQAFGITRQAVNRHLHKMCDEGLLTATGNTRSRQYFLQETKLVDELLDLKSLQEDVPWTNTISPHLADVRQNVHRILNYGFTEILNNAIDHSGSTKVGISLRRSVQNVELEIVDFGIGIFKKIKDAFSLTDELHAICQLATGKLTTDPAHHSGEGIFFTSRMFDYFSILSGSLYFRHTKPHENAPDNDWLIETNSHEHHSGTYVRMRMALNSTTEYASVFNRFASEENDYKFSKTHVPVMLLQYGADNLVSRSQAKRILSRFHVFDEVLLDFSGVEFIGQGFADEIFRVYKRQHPDVNILFINALPQIQSMISHAISNRDEPLTPP